VLQLPNAAFQIEAYTPKGFAPASAQNTPNKINEATRAAIGKSRDSSVLRQA
jgi:hypothetical protein